jgi:hypothetical protein
MLIYDLFALKQRDELLPGIDDLLRRADRAAAAGNGLAPQLRESVLGFRLQIYQARKDVVGCRETVEWYERVGGTSAGYLYDAACYRAVLAGLLAGDPAAAEADKAMDWLRKAVAAGYSNRPHIDGDTDLDALRGRADFRALVGSLPYPAPPPRPVSR